jgi:hypothetical protein
VRRGIGPKRARVYGPKNMFRPRDAFPFFYFLSKFKVSYIKLNLHFPLKSKFNKTNATNIEYQHDAFFMDILFILLISFF